jgi:hypothetical protein
VAVSVQADPFKEIAAAKQEETSKKRADDLWADFMKDVGGSRKTTTSSVTDSYDMIISN